MDNFTHTLVGVGLSRAGINKRYGGAATWILAIASNLPDLDVLGALVFKQDSFLYRRMFTHGVLGIPLIALLAAFIFRKIFKQLTFLQVFGLTLFGMAFHVVFDLINSYGVAFLYPFSWQRFELSWVFIIDLMLWAFLLAPVILTRFRAFKGQPVEANVFRLFMGLVALYIASCGALHWRSRYLLIKEAARQQAQPAAFIYAFPEALGAHRFKGVIRFGTDYQLFQVFPFSGHTRFVKMYDTAEGTPDYEELKDNRRVRQLNWFFKAPVWRVRRFESDKHALVRLECFDLRFISTVLPMKRPPFTFQVYSDRPHQQ